MVRKTRVVQTIVDDIDGVELAEGEGQTVRYAWQGKHYELDVSDEHANGLQSIMQPILERSRPYRPEAVTSTRSRNQTALPTAEARAIEGGGGATGRRLTKVPEKDRAAYAQRQAIREWGNANGYPQGAIGKIKEATKIAYYEANPNALRV